MSRKDTANNKCPCDSGRTFDTCCGAILSKRRPAPTAEALMRSRYVAYVQRNEQYLLKSWHPDTRPQGIDFAERQKWLGLRVVSVQAGGADDSSGVVEFVARYRIDGRGQRLHEVSRFVRSDCGWQYVDAETSTTD